MPNSVNIMKKLTVRQIAEAVNGDLLHGNPEDVIYSISTDSREVLKGEAFFPLIGERHDAHDFIPQALDRGCSLVVLSKMPENQLLQRSSVSFLLVENTTEALQKLAKYYLSLLNIKKIGVTGSTGKTTTKEMLYRIFSEKYKTSRNPGNFNNHIGLPLTVLSIPEDIEVGVFEMGMSELGEIDLLAGLVHPDIGIITNIGNSHIENLGSRENILKAKLEIVNYFDQKNILIINEESDLLSKETVKGRYRVITIGKTGKSDFILSNINDFGEEGIEFTVEYEKVMHTFRLLVPGRHNAYNAALAIAAGISCGISQEEAAAGLLKLEIADKRLSIKGKNGMKIIDDTYNASPDSMRAAIDVLIETKGFRKIAILADMFELGDKSADFHREVGQYAADSGLDLLIAVGELAEHIAKGAKGKLEADKIHYYKTKEMLIKDIGSMISAGDVILLKGSRGMAMDQVAKKIMETS